MHLRYSYYDGSTWTNPSDVDVDHVVALNVTLMSGELRGLVTAIALSQATMRNIRQNLVLAFGYNTAAIPLAAGVLYPVTGALLSPMIAAAAMALSSISVVLNSARLNRFTPPALPRTADGEQGLPAVRDAAPQLRGRAEAPASPGPRQEGSSR